MDKRPLNRVEVLYLRIHDTPDSQAYISIETSDAKHLTQYAYRQYATLRSLERILSQHLCVVRRDRPADMDAKIKTALELVRGTLGQDREPGREPTA